MLKSNVVRNFAFRAYSFFSIAFIGLSIPSVWAQTPDDAILLSLGDHEVTAYEFVRLYQKNSQTAGTGDPLDVEEYLDLFVNFKRKVLDAEAMGLDTLRSFRNELDGYKNQLAVPFLTDQEALDSLVREAFKRMQTEIHASHILVKMPPGALPADTLRAYEKAMSIRDRILLTGESFDLVARGVSDDPSAKTNSGNLGYFTVFQMTYPFESACYNASIGEITLPVRTRFGYHLIKIHEKRDAQGTIKVAHIMVAVPRSSSPEFEEQAREKVFNIYDRLLDGESFADLAREFSDDYKSAPSGGELAWFGTGRMVPEFENAAFDLEKNGEISKPVKTGFGWHIIKRLDWKGVESFDAARDELKQKVLRSDRAEIARDAFLEELMNEYDLWVDTSALYPFYMAIDEESIATGNWEDRLSIDLKRPFMGFNDHEYTLGDLKEYIRGLSGRTFSGTPRSIVDQFLRSFRESELMDYEKNRLDEKNREFRYLIKEYHDGMLLFEISDRKVWSKAVEDTAGMVKFYKSHQKNYMDEATVEILDFTIHDPNWTRKLQKAIRKGRKKSYALDYFDDLLPADPSKVPFEYAQKTLKRGEHLVVDDMHWKKGAYRTFSEDGQMQIILITTVHPAIPKPLDSIRGSVTSDYQNALEQDWLKNLEGRYPLELNYEVFDRIQSNLE
jgi:peptidyl-prolyl cis-trans isomerase SurA